MDRRLAALILALAVGRGTAAVAEELEVKLASITSPVHPGETVTFVVRTEPGALCEGRRQGHFGNDIPLRAQRAGSDGLARWEWRTMSGTHPVGSRDIHVACSSNERHGTLDSAFVVN